MFPDDASVFAALGDQTRMNIIAQLSTGYAQSISQLSSSTPLTRQAITKHLKVLETAGLISKQRIGRETRFELEPERLQHAQSYLAELTAQWDGKLDDLRAHVEQSNE